MTKTEFEPKEQIVGVALNMNGMVCFLLKPNRHCHLFNAVPDDNDDFVVKANPLFHAEQGFITNKMRFLSRKQAYELAKNNGQLKSDVFSDRSQQLYSENLW